MSVPDYPLEQTLDFKFTTRAFATGIPTTLAGTPAIEVYEDNSVTQITAGETLTADFDSITGLNNLRIVATAANGYESGKSYAAVISTGTVGGVSVVGEIVQQFSIERAAALRPTTAGRTLDVAATGEAGLDFGNATGSITGAELGVGAFASAAITADAIATDAIGSAELAASAATEIRDAVTGGAYALDTDANGRVRIVDGTGAGELNTNSGAVALVDLVTTTTTNSDMRGTDNAALASVLGALADAAAAGDPTSADTVMQYAKQLVNVLVGTDGVATFPAEAAPGNAVSLAEVMRAIHVDVTGLNGDAMRGTDSAALASVCTEGRLAELDAANLPADLDATLADTNELQGDWANAGRLDVILDARASQTTADAIETDTQDIQSRIPAALVGGRMDSDVEAINNNTAAADNLQAHALTAVSVTCSAGGTTTTAVLNQVDGAGASSTDDVYNGRVLIFTAPAGLKYQATDITDYDGGTLTATITAVTTGPGATATAILV